MNKKIPKDEISEKLKNGVTKSEIYLEFKDAYDDVCLRKYLASRPSNEVHPTARKVQKTILIIWIVFWVLELLSALSSIIIFDLSYLISFAISTYAIIQIWKFNGDIYLPGIFWFSWAILASLKEYFTYDEYDLDRGFFLIITLVYLGMLGVGIWLMLQLRRHVFGYYTWFEPKLDAKGAIMYEDE